MYEFFKILTFYFICYSNTTKAVFTDIKIQDYPAYKVHVHLPKLRSSYI